MSAETYYIIIEGDSIPRTAINLNEVTLLHKLKFDSKEDRKRYLILRRKTIKVYPYAKLAAERLQTLNERIASMDRKRDKKKYTKNSFFPPSEMYSQSSSTLSEENDPMEEEPLHQDGPKRTTQTIRIANAFCQSANGNRFKRTLPRINRKNRIHFRRLELWSNQRAVPPSHPS